MKYVVVLTVILIYAFGLLCTSLVGHGLIFDHGKAPSYAKEIFPTVLDSMFVLFQVMNGDIGDLELFFDDFPWFKVFFVAFMIISNWAILAILAAVVSENMIRATEREEQLQQSSAAAHSEEHGRQKLTEIFAEIDKDGSLSVSEEEFQQLVANEALTTDLCEVANLKARDLQELWLILSDEDEDGSRTVKFETFVEKLPRENQPVNE